MSFFNNGSNYNESNYTWKGDFLGFTLGGVHSSTLGIVRVSDNNRYDEDLLPNYQDITANVPGRDETYYFGSTYTQRELTVKIAYDHLTDSQLRKLKQLLSKKEPQDLIFDETPYKVYSVKCKDKPSLSYLCFDEDYHRIYKGEGTINFVAYFPFARSRYNYIEDYNAKNIPEWGGIEDNKMEWLESSGIPSKNNRQYFIIGENVTINDVTQSLGLYYEKLEVIQSPGNTSIYGHDKFIFLKNPGDMATNFNFTLRNHSGNANYKLSLKKISQSESADIVSEIVNTENEKKVYVDLSRVTSFDQLKSIVKTALELQSISDSQVREYTYSSAVIKEIGYLVLNIPSSGFYTIDNNNHLIMYYNDLTNYQNKNNGQIFNDKIVSGDFFKIPPSSENEYYCLEIVPLETYLSGTYSGQLRHDLEFDYVDRYNYLYY